MRINTTKITLVVTLICLLIIIGATYIIGNVRNIPLGNLSEIWQVIAALLGVLGLVYTLISQQEQFAKQDIRDKFFKMLDYHNEIVSQISVIEYNVKKGVFVSKIEATELHGRQAFVAYKKQLKELYKFVAEITPQNEEKDEGEKELNEVIIGVVYIIFHYGFSQEWQDALKTELENYLSKKEEKFGLSSDLIIEKLTSKSKDNSASTKNLLRTNQTYLSAYYQNMYNAIKLIDSDNTLGGKKKKCTKNKRKSRNKKAEKTEKENLISILRAQLSHPELYVLFYSLFWKFGETWDKKNYIEGYEFIKNISKVDLDLDKVKRKYAKDKVKLKKMKGIDPRDYFPAMNYEDYLPKKKRENKVCKYLCLFPKLLCRFLCCK